MINRIRDFEQQSDKRRELEIQTPIAPLVSGGLPQVTRLAQKHPEILLVIGAVAGLTFGWWVKRK